MAKRKDTQRQTNPNVIAVLHRFGTRWLAVIAHVQGARPRLLAAEAIADDKSSQINRLLDEHAVGEVISVLPSSSVICRSVDLPEVPSDQLQSVLELQAEAHLAGIAPPHRMSMAVLPEAVDDEGRSGLVLAWPESTEPPMPPVHDRPVRFTGDIAGMAGLLGGQRSEEPMLVIDRINGSIGIAMKQASGVRFRAACEDSPDSAVWSQMVIRALAETAMNAGYSDSAIESMSNQTRSQLTQFMSDKSSTELDRDSEAAILIPADLMNSLTGRVQGAKLEQEWWSTFGVAIGVVLARHGDMAPLLTILHEPRVERPSRLVQVAHKLANPRTAVATIAVCLILAAILPTLLTGLRLATLRVRHADLDQRLFEVNQLEKQVTMYRILSDQAWPITKLLADLAACTPRGIDLEVIRVEQGQTMTVSGRSTPTDGKTAIELIGQMQENLLSTRVFHSPSSSWEEGSRMTQSYDFDLTVRINDAHRQVTYDIMQNFALYPMQDRVDGKPAPTLDGGSDTVLTGEGTETAVDLDSRPADANTQTAVARDARPTETTTSTDDPMDQTDTVARGATESPTDVAGDSPDDDDDGRSRTRRPQSGDTGVATGTATADQRDQTPGSTRTMPEILSESQISQMNRTQVMASLSEVANARNWFRNDEEATEKLDAQFRLLMNRLRELPPE